MRSIVHARLELPEETQGSDRARNPSEQVGVALKLGSPPRGGCERCDGGGCGCWPAWRGPPLAGHARHQRRQVSYRCDRRLRRRYRVAQSVSTTLRSTPHAGVSSSRTWARVNSVTLTYMNMPSCGRCRTCLTYMG